MLSSHHRFLTSYKQISRKQLECRDLAVKQRLNLIGYYTRILHSFVDKECHDLMMA